MSPLRKYILYSTVIGLFTNSYMFNVGPIHLLYFYAIVLINLTILAVLGYLWVPRMLVLFFAYLFVSGTVGIVLGIGSETGFLKEFAGIVPNALYAAAFYRYMRFDVIGCFEAYARWAYYIAFFGIFYMPFQPWGNDRLMSICQEPSSFCILVVPAIFFYADQWQRERRGAWRVLVIFVAIVLSVSSLGYLGLLCGMFLFGRRYRFGKLGAPLTVVAIVYLLFNYSPSFRLRINDAIIGSAQGDVGEINQSTFGVLANYYITVQAFENSPFIGGGLGSYVESHARFLQTVPGIYFINDQDLLMLGQWDASSLLLRITAEFGLLGLCGALWFFVYYFPRGGLPIERAVAMAVICCMFMKFLRDGSYFYPEFFFFLGSYTVLGALTRERRRLADRTRAQLAAPAPATIHGLPAPEAV